MRHPPAKDRRAKPVDEIAQTLAEAKAVAKRTRSSSVNTDDAMPPPPRPAKRSPKKAKPPAPRRAPKSAAARSDDDADDEMASVAAVDERSTASRLTPMLHVARGGDTNRLLQQARKKKHQADEMWRGAKSQRERCEALDVFFQASLDWLVVCSQVSSTSNTAKQLLDDTCIFLSNCIASAERAREPMFQSLYLRARAIATARSAAMERTKSESELHHATSLARKEWHTLERAGANHSEVMQRLKTLPKMFDDDNETLKRPRRAREQADKAHELWQRAALKWKQPLAWPGDGNVFAPRIFSDNIAFLKLVRKEWIVPYIKSL